MPGPNSLSITDERTGKNYRIPIWRNTIKATDIQQIKADEAASAPDDLAQDGIRLIDNGARNTAPMTSQVSHLSPHTGILQYREYDIEDLFRRASVEECFHLLVWGRIPSSTEKEKLRKAIFAASMPHDVVRKVIAAHSRDAPFTTMITTAIGAWSSADPMQIPVLAPASLYEKTHELDECIPRLFGALGTIVALVYCHRHSRDLTPAQPDLTFVENLLLMMGFCDPGTNRPDPQQVQAVESLIVLQCEHGLSTATAVFLHCTSTRTDPWSCLAAAIGGALYGRINGGSNIVTYRQLKQIGTVDKIPAFIADVKAKKQLLYGVGHRIYRTIDPRARILREMLVELRNKGYSIPFLDVAFELERQAGSGALFGGRKLYPNTDMFTVLAYEASGVPEELVFPMICIARAQGMFAHWREQVEQRQPQWRPQQVYTGPPVARKPRL